MNSTLAYAQRLFYLLVTVEIAFFSFFNLFKKDGIADFFADLLIKLLGGNRLVPSIAITPN